MTKSNANRRILAWATAAALAAAALGGGCQSDNTQEAQVDESADQIDHNRLLVRAALAEGVYNGIAAERAVYPKDFDPSSAVLNRLGTQRIETLASTSRTTRAPIVVVRGDAADDLYAARIESVRKELEVAGIRPGEVAIARDTHVGGGSIPSDRALLSYERLMSDYAPTKQGDGNGGGSADGPSNMSPSRNNSSNTRRD